MELYILPLINMEQNMPSKSSPNLVYANEHSLTSFENHLINGKEAHWLVSILLYTEGLTQIHKLKPRAR